MFDNSDEYEFTPSKSSKLASLFGLSSVSNEATSNSLIYKPPKQPASQESKKQINTSEGSKTKTSTIVIIAKVVNLWKLKVKSYELLGRYGLALIGSTDLNLYEIICYKEKNDIIFRTKVNNNFIFYNQKENFSTFCDENSQQWLIKFENGDQTEFSKQIEAFGAKINNNIDESEQKSSFNYETSSKPEISLKPQQSTEVHSDNSGSDKRATILNRMAKMGQPILPTLPVKNITSSELSDSQSEIEENKSDKRIPSRKFKRTNTEKLSKDELLTQVMDNRQILPVQNNSVNSAFNLPAPVIYGQPFGYDSVNNIILAQNTELKMNLAHINAKLDSIVNESNTVHGKNSNNQLKAKIKALELKLENLQRALEKSEDKYLNLKEKYDLFKKSNDKNNIEIRENKIKKLEEEITQLKVNLKNGDEILKNKEGIEIELEKYKAEIKEQEKIIDNQNQKLKDFEQLHEQNKNTEELESTIKILNAKIENLKLKQKDFDDYFKQCNLDRKDQTRKANSRLNTYSEIVKHHINDMYQSVLDDFDDDIACSYSYSDIQGIIAKRLKGITFKLIEDCKNIFLESSELVD